MFQNACIQSDASSANLLTLLVLLCFTVLAVVLRMER